MVIADIISQVCSALLGALTQFVTAIPTAIKTCFTTLFFDTSGNTTVVSEMASVLLVFGGVALAIGLTRWVTHLLSRKVGA